MVTGVQWDNPSRIIIPKVRNQTLGLLALNHSILKKIFQYVDHFDIIDAVDDSGFTALHDAIGEKHSSIVQTLLVYGANPNVKDKCEMSGHTPLHWAVRLPMSSFSIVETLLVHGADVNITDNRGQTPLDCAFQWYGSKKCDAIIRCQEQLANSKTPIKN